MGQKMKHPAKVAEVRPDKASHKRGAFFVSDRQAPPPASPSTRRDTSRRPELWGRQSVVCATGEIP